MQTIEKCGAKNPSTCRYHGIASIFAPVNDAKAAQALLEKAGYEALSAVGKVEFNKAEKAREAAGRQLLSVPSVLHLNKAAADKLWSSNDVNVKESYRAYLRWNTGTIEREKAEAIHRAAIFSTKSLYGELTVTDLKSLAPRTSAVKVQGNKIFLDGNDKPLLGVENGKAVVYSDSPEETKTVFGEESFKLGRVVAEKRVAQVEARQEKLMLSHTTKLATYLGGKVETSTDPYSPNETIHTIRTGSGDAIAQYVTVKGAFNRGSIAMDGRWGTSRTAKLWDIEYRLIEASNNGNLEKYRLLSYMTEDQSTTVNYDNFGQPAR